jgi:hypothetical protein
MSIRFSETVKVNQKFTKLQKELEIIKDSSEYTKVEVKKVNNHLDAISEVIEAKIQSGDAPLIKNWAHVEDITESDRYPLVNSKNLGIERETQVLLKKLDII